MDKLRAVAEPLGATALTLDVTDAASVAAFCAASPRVNVLVNNAGGALGLEPSPRPKMRSGRRCTIRTSWARCG